MYENKETDNREMISDLIRKYNLTPISEEEAASISNLDDIKPISSPQQLELVLKHVNAVQEKSTRMENCFDFLDSPVMIKTDSEIGQSTAAITGSNENGSATVYVDLLTPAVNTSIYQLGLMDAFLEYTHLSGSAEKKGNAIYFKAYGMGIVKVIYQGIELYRFKVEIEGNCDTKGNGTLTKF